MSRRVPRWHRPPIRRTYLRDIERAIEENTAAIEAVRAGAARQFQAPATMNPNVPPEDIDNPAIDQIEQQSPLQASDESFIEVSRSTSTVRVENPEDSEQYVDVVRVEAVTLISTQGRVLELSFDND